MKNFKKVVAAGLALLMLALSVNVTFAAEEYNDAEAVAVAKVNAAGVMTGTDKGFEPNKTLTRAEAAAIFVRMKGISEATVKQNAGTTLFTDVPASHWAAGYINVATNYDIIVGVGANKFAPEKEVSVAEFYTMAVRALGAKKLVESEGTWPTNYVNFAIENDLAEDVAQIYTANATRMTAATIVVNTLTANMWAKSNYKSNGEITWSNEEVKTILYNTLHIVEVENVKFADINTKDSEVDVEGTWLKDVKKVGVEVNSKAGLGSAKKGVAYTVWYDTKEEEIVGFWVPTSTDAITFTNVKSTAEDSKLKLVVDGKEKEYDVIAGNATTTYFELNGKVQEVKPQGWTDGDPLITDWSKLVKGDMPLFGIAYLDNDGKKVEKVYAETYTNFGVVKDATSARIAFEKSADVLGSNGSTINIKKDEDSDYQYFVTRDGKAIDIEDIAEGDVLFYYTKDTNKTFVIDVFEDTIEGKVSSTSGTKVTIDGKKYDSILADGVRAIKAGDEGTFYLNNDGKIVMYELEDEKEGDYAVISERRLLNASYADEKDLIQVKLATLDGEVSDWMRINDKKTFESVTVTSTNVDTINANKARGVADFAVDATAIKVMGKYYASKETATTAGTVVQYEIKDGKVVLKDTEAVYFEKFTDAKIDFVGTKDTEGQVYLNSNTKAYEVNQYETNKYKLIEVSVDDLDSDPAAKGFYGDYDKNEDEAGYVFFTSEVVKTAEANWAFILDASYDYDNGDDESDIDSIYEVVFADGTKDFYYADASEVKLLKGYLYELTLKDNEITKAKAEAVHEGEKKVSANTKLEDAGLANKYVHEVKDNGLVTFIATADNKISGNPTSGFALADKVMVIVKDKDDYTVSDFESIVKLTEDNDEVVLDLDDYNKVNKAIKYTDDDETEIVLIVVEK